MRVIYSTCLADPWVKVAQKLKADYGFEPVYWNGYANLDDSRQLVSAAFPNAIYHDSMDACKGIFPNEIATRFPEAHIPINFLRKYSNFELQAIKMMDRMDPDQYSFNFMERQRHFRNLVKYWTACINFLKPDLFVSDNVPHMVFDHVLYLLCNFHRIQFITFRGSPFLGRFIPLTDVFSIGNLLDAEYAAAQNSGASNDELKKNLPQEILSAYEKARLDYSTAEPDTMRKNRIEHRKSTSLLLLAKKFFFDMHRYRDKYFGRDGFFQKGMPTFSKQRNRSIETSRMTVLRYMGLKVKANAHRGRLKNYYESLAVMPDFDVPYLIFNLHYQPESSTSPAGDIYVDQRICVDVLARHLPADYWIYVKEHRSQFYSQFIGETGRIPHFYDDIKSYPRVRLMPMNADPFELMAHAKAVVTVTGTSGWEAMVRGKPVICFGLSWYEKFEGVLRIVDEESAARIASFIEGYSYNERGLLAYLSAYGKQSVRAYAHRGYKEEMEQDENECVSVLAACIQRTVCK